MFYFTKYAEEKFEILNKYKVFFTKERVEDAIANAEKISKKRKYLITKKDGVAVIYKKEDDVVKIITFYPIK